MNKSAHSWGDALIPATRIVLGGDEFVIVGDVEKDAEGFVDLLRSSDLEAKTVLALCRKHKVDVYIHDGSMVVVWRPGKFGVPMIGDIIHVGEANPLKWGKYIGRLFNNVDHVVENVGIQFMKLDMALNDGGGIVSRSFLQRTFGEQYPESVYYTYLGVGGLTKGLAVIGDTFGSDLLIPSDTKSVSVMGMDGVIAVSAGHSHTQVEIDNQSMQNIDSIKPMLTSWLISQFGKLKETVRGAIPSWMEGANVPSMRRKFARTLGAGITEDAIIRIKVPLLRAYYRPSEELIGDEVRITISDSMYKGHPALILLEFSVARAKENLATMGGGDYDDPIIIDADEAGQVVYWRQPNTPGEFMVGQLVGTLDKRYTHEHVWDAKGVANPATIIKTIIDGKVMPSSLAEAYKIASESKGMIGGVVNTIALLKDIMGRFPKTMPSLEGIIAVQNKGAGQFSRELHRWMYETNGFIRTHSEFISEFFWGKYSEENKGEWKPSDRGIISSFEDVLLALARKLLAEFLAWVERSVVPFDLPPRKWVDQAPHVENKGLIGRLYGELLKEAQNKGQIQRKIAEFRVEIQQELRVFENMPRLEERLEQHTVLSLFEGNSGWTATSTAREFGVGQIVKVGYNATPYNWGNRDFAVTVKFFAHNWAISENKLVLKKPSEVTDVEKSTILAKYMEMARKNVWVEETLTFNNGMVFWQGNCVGLATVPDGMYEGRVSFMHYFEFRDTAWVVVTPIVATAIVPAGFWDEAYKVVEEAKADIDWMIEAEREFAPIITVKNKCATATYMGLLFKFKARTNAEAEAKAHAFFE